MGCLALPEGTHVCLVGVLSSHIWAWVERQQSVWVRAKGMVPSKPGRRAPTPPQICVSEWWRRGSVQPRGGDTALSSQSHCQAEEAEGPWPAKLRPQNHLLPSAPACLPLRDAERREQVEGRENGPMAVRRGLTLGLPSSPARGWEAPPELSLARLLRDATGHRGRPQPRVGGVRSTSGESGPWVRPGAEARATPCRDRGPLVPPASRAQA